MLTNNLPSHLTKLVVAPRPVELVLADGGLTTLTLILPPLEDLTEMTALREVQFSQKELAAVEWQKLEAVFTDELEALQNKEGRFHDAPTFLNRLANLAELAGDRGREEGYLRRMRDVVNDEFVAHRLGENLLSRGMTSDAEKLFSSLKLDQDAYANLRLAFFHVQRRDLDSALASVGRALAIDPLSFSARLFEGSLRLVRGEYQLAIQSFKFAADDRKTSCPLFTNLALAYVYCGKPEKALAALRKAVALDPWNENAIALLADLAFSKNRNEDAVPSLRYFLQYEQKNATMWARLARALLELGQTTEAIEALKRQGSIENTPSVWNNLGVAYLRRREKRKAYETFKYAMRLEIGTPSRGFFLAARNLTALLSDDHAYKEVLTFAKAVFSDDASRVVLSDPKLADMFIFYVSALMHTGAIKEAVSLSENLVSTPSAAPNAVAWLVTSLIAYYSLGDETSSTALDLIERHKGLLTTLNPQHTQIKEMLLNNIAFAYLEFGHVDTAQEYLQQLTHVFHKEPYSTATLGLFHLRKGNVERGELLYQEAIRLALAPEDKKRIRQKLNLEVGLRYIDSDPARARRYLNKAADRDGLVPQLAARARSLLNSLSRPT
jgi:tetratricopeptide (TPR) repeat protein